MDTVAVRNVKQLPSDQARQEAAAGLTQTWEKVEQYMQQHGITEEEFDVTVDEAVDDVRRRQA